MHIFLTFLCIYNNNLILTDPIDIYSYKMFGLYLLMNTVNFQSGLLMPIHQNSCKNLDSGKSPIWWYKAISAYSKFLKLKDFLIVKFIILLLNLSTIPLLKFFFALKKLRINSLLVNIIFTITFRYGFHILPHITSWKK